MHFFLSSHGPSYLPINIPSKQVVDIILDDAEKTLGIKRETVYTKIATVVYLEPPACLICLDRILREETVTETDKRVYGGQG